MWIKHALQLLVVAVCSDITLHETNAQLAVPSFRGVRNKALAS